MKNNYRNSLVTWRATVQDAQYTPNASGYSVVAVTINNKTIPGDTSYNVPVSYPYGFISFPITGCAAVGEYLTGTIQNPIMTGIFPAFTSEDYRLNGLVAGESAQYSQIYSVQVKNSGVFYTSQQNSSSPFTATAVNGEWMAKILTDILSQLTELYQSLAVVQSTLNSHIHPVSGNSTTAPTTQVNFGSINSTIAADQSAVSAGEIYISTTGTKPESA